MCFFQTIRFHLSKPKLADIICEQPLMVNPQGMLGDGVLVATNLNTAFHNQWKPKQPAGRVQVVTKVLKTRKVI